MQAPRAHIHIIRLLKVTPCTTRRGMECNDCHWTGSTFLLGVLDLHNVTGDAALLAYVRRWAEYYDYRVCGERRWGRTDDTRLRHNVNHQLSGSIYVELFLRDRNRTHLRSTALLLGEEIADAASVNFWAWVDLIHMAMNTYRFVDA